MQRIITIFAALLLLGVGMACERQEAEETEREIEQAGQEIEEGAERVGQEIEEEFDEGMQAIEEAVGDEDTSLAEVIDEIDGLDTFSDALDEAGLEEMLEEEGEGTYTVFAPTNQAFEALGEERLEELMDDDERLKRILQHHIVSGKTMAADVEAGDLETLDGNTVTVEVDGEEVTFHGARVIGTDIKASNGVIHVIDQVVMPPEEGSAM